MGLHIMILLHIIKQKVHIIIQVHNNMRSALRSGHKGSEDVCIHAGKVPVMPGSVLQDPFPQIQTRGDIKITRSRITKTCC